MDNGEGETTRSTPVLEMIDIDKRFPGVHAVRKCSLRLDHGEVLALVGENGAGKSTMMKILTGIYQDYDGDIFLFGRKIRFENTYEARLAGISIVHQELNMLNHMTVAKNIFIGRESDGFFYNEKKLNQNAQALIDEFKIHIKPTDRISDLSVGKIQMVEIARAMSFSETKVLILDEPTAALSASEAQELFHKIRILKERGISVIFISHRMGEIMEIADKVTVMRDGECVDTVETGECGISDIIKMMVGREISHEAKAESRIPKDAPIVLEAKNLSSKAVHDVSFRLRRGEILGFAGLVGAGRTEVMRLIFGADRMESGEIRIKNRLIRIRHPSDAVRSGLGYLSEDRKRYGVVVGLPLVDNAVMASIDDFIRSKLFVDRSACIAETEKYIDSLKIKATGCGQLVKNLSGGNQQKVVVAKWLIKNCDILVFDEPTRGIDVGTKSEIYDLMRKLAAEGKSIIMISSDLPEVLHMCDRVVVMCEGRKTAELDIARCDSETIMKYATRHVGEGCG